MPRALTPQEVHRNGHASAALRFWMETFGIKSYSQLNPWIGLKRGDTRLWVIVSGQGCPSRTLREKLAELTGIPGEHFAPRAPEDQTTLALPARASLKPPPGFQALVTTEEPKRPVARSQPRSDGGDPLAFRVHGDGTATIQVNVRRPVAHAMSVFRMLMEAGLEVTEE